MRKFTYTVSLTVLCVIRIFAAEPDSVSTPDRYQRLDLSYSFAEQVYNNNMIYNPGLAASASYGLMLNESVSLGLGTGYTALQEERFIPVFLETMGYIRNKPSTPVILMQVGYAFGWHTGIPDMEGYKFRGGIYIDAGMGRKININTHYSVFFHVSYRHQFARMEYEVFGGQSFKDDLNYDMLLISLGLIRH